MARDLFDKVLFGGIEPISSIDWPGVPSCILFFRGCPLSCKHCHNLELMQIAGEEPIDISVVESYITDCLEYVDAVIFSGGEPYLQYNALMSLASFAHKLDLKVGVETSGIFPELVERSVKEGYVDKVFLDLKVLPGYYKSWSGNPNGGNAFKVLTYKLPDVEVRTTVFKENSAHVPHIAKYLTCLPYRYVLQLGECKNKIDEVDEKELIKIASRLPLKDIHIRTRKGEFKI